MIRQASGVFFAFHDRWVAWPPGHVRTAPVEALDEHPDCTPARLVVADYMAERGDLDGALQWPRAALEAALLRQQRYLEAPLMLGEVCDVLGDTLAALRPRTRLFPDANAQGRWISPETTGPQWQQAVRRAVEAYRRDKRERLFAAFLEVRERHGANSLRRVERAVTGYLRESGPSRTPRMFHEPEAVSQPSLRDGPNSLFFQ